ncbi:hypothetical protein [Thioclava sp.]|uniref:hypothetical protein n=1 Tax=Thioclava sp. TaxID=1933450 RepID=UPI00324207E1
MASAEEVITRGAPDSAPACPAKADALLLSRAIQTKDFAVIKDLASNKGCWGVWDGSTGKVLDLDEGAGLALVEFDHLARLPAGRTATLWLAAKVLSPKG